MYQLRNVQMGEENIAMDIINQAKAKGISNFRVDTDADNQIMQHVLKKNGFVYCGVIWFDNSEKIAFEKLISFCKRKKLHFFIEKIVSTLPFLCYTQF